MRIFKKIKRFFFGIHELVWWFVAELEDWLYPYRDREATKPLWAEGYPDEITVDEISYLKSQMQSANERIERLQSEMITVLRRTNQIQSNPPHGKE